MIDFVRDKRRWPAAVALLGMGAVGYTLGSWHGRSADVAAQSPANVPSAATPTDYSQRVIAYIYGNVPVTREELGEFLIARYAQSKMELLVNRKIIDRECQKANVAVTDQEVEAALNEDLGLLSMDRVTFVKQYLKQFGKSLFEWKEDVIKPRLMLTKLCESQISVDEDEIKRAFEAEHGEKVQCRMILWPGDQGKRLALKEYDKLRNSEAEFDAAARSQAMPTLAACGGRINPIGKPFDEAAMLEKVAFKLKPGELSEIFEIRDQGVAVLRCERRIPPDATKTYESEREKLRKAVFNRKVSVAIPKMFEKMKAEANPTMILKYGTRDQDVIKAAEEELKLSNQPERTAVPLPNGPVKQPR